MDFWSSFWPSLAANTVAVFLGVPFAIWVNRWAIGRSESMRQAEDLRVLKESLTALQKSVENSKYVLLDVQGVLEEGKVPLDAFVETDTWQTLRPFIAPRLQRPETIRELSSYFSNLEIVSRIIIRFIDKHTQKSMSSRDFGVNRAIEHERQFLIRRLGQLSQDAHRIEGELESIITTPSPAFARKVWRKYALMKRRQMIGDGLRRLLTFRLGKAKPTPTQEN